MTSTLCLRRAKHIAEPPVMKPLATGVSARSVCWGLTDLPFEYLPFGGGYRRWLGAAFAMYELAVAVGTMLGMVMLAMPARERRRVTRVDDPIVGTLLSP